MKVASFESLEFLFSKSRKKYSVVAFPGGPCTGLTKENYDTKNIIQLIVPGIEKLSEIKKYEILIDIKKMSQKTNLDALLKKKSIKGLMPDTYSSPFIEKWAQDKGINLVVTPTTFQKKVEDKVFFNKFLCKHKLPVPKNIILTSPKDLDKINFFPVMIQIPKSVGSEGTFFIRNKNEILDLLYSHKKAKFPLLCREFIGESLPLGVSVMIGPKKLIFSAVRAQMFFTQPNRKSLYYGIQWMKTDFFEPTVIQKMNVSLKKAAKELQKTGFRGIAAFDFMFRKEDIYFIECNPRTGGSSPQIALRPELFHGLNLTDEFIRCTTGKELTAHKPFIPNSDYEGVTLDLGFVMDVYPLGIELNFIQNGIFKFDGTRLHFDSFKLENFQGNDSIFMYYVRPKGAILTNTNFIGFLFTHFPLLEIQKNRYIFSQKANNLLDYLRKIMIKNAKTI